MLQVLANCTSLTIQQSTYDYCICITEKEIKVWKLNNMWLTSCNSPIKDCCSRRKVWKEKIWKWFGLKTGGHKKGKTCPGSHHIVNDIAGFLLFIQWAYEVKGSGKKYLLFSYPIIIKSIKQNVWNSFIPVLDPRFTVNLICPSLSEDALPISQSK